MGGNILQVIFIGTNLCIILPVKERVLPPSTIYILPTKENLLPTKERQFYVTRFLLYKQ